MLRIVTWIAALVIAAVLGAAAWLFIAPPDMIRVAVNYSAKMVCSNVFIAGRDPGEVLEVDVQAPGHPILRLVSVSVDRDRRTVRAGLFGLFGSGLSIYRDGVGCATVADGDIDATRIDIARKSVDPAERSKGMQTVTPEDTELSAILNDIALAGPGMRAIVVVKDGKIVGERYGDGFDAETPLLGWSMTKTVTAAIIGRLIRDGQINLEKSALLDRWQADERRDIRISDLMGMASDLSWNEGYGNVSDVTRMLYLEPDMASFVAGKALDTDNRGETGEVFHYSSGTSVILARIWQDTFDDQADAMAYPQNALFGPLGMQSAVLEADARGTFAGSSYLYATARDWARFGQFLLQRGVWQGRSLLPTGYVDWMVELHPASGGEYGRGHVWRRAPNLKRPGFNPELPGDAFFMSGHDGQSVTVVPSHDLVVVRMGLTPSERNYKVANLVQALLETLDDR